MFDLSSHLFLRLVNLFVPQLIPRVNRHLVKMEGHALWWLMDTNAHVRQDLWGHTVNVSFITNKLPNILKGFSSKPNC